MVAQERRQVLLENLIYLIIWMILFVAPILGFKYSDDTTVKWNEVFHSWKMIAPFFALFVFNNYMLVPLLLLRKRTWLYLLSVIAVVGIVFLANPYPIGPTDPDGRTRLLMQQLRSGERLEDLLQGDRRNDLSDSVSVGQSGVQHAEPKPLSQPDFQSGRRDFQPGQRRSPEADEFQRGQRRGMEADEFPPTMRRNPGPRDPFFFFMSPFLKFLMMAILVIGLNLAIKLMFRLMREGQRVKELEKQTLQSELEYLKYQINPHFFMNTLNNIHALIDMDAEKAKETVLDLSKMMRYVLYDTEQSKLPLEKEIQFLTNYIDLMKLRYTDQVDIRIDFPKDIPNVQVPPLLFISFLENAFKHGVSYRQKSYISLSIEVVNNTLECKIENSKSNGNSNGNGNGNGNQASQDSGIGLENVKKRLRLLYNDDYTLNIQDEKDSFKVLLIIPI